MRHINYSTGTYNIAILIKDAALNQKRIQQEYLDRLEEKGINTDGVCAFSLDYANKKKPTALVKKAYIAELLPALENLNIKILLVNDGEYFKTLTKTQKIDPNYGYVLPCKIEGYEHMSIVLGVNYQMFFYKPDMKDKLDLSIQALANYMQGNCKALGSDVIESMAYPKTLSAIKDMLISLHQYPVLTCDIEAFSLKHYDSGIGTIAFAWDQHNGIAFSVDYVVVEAHEIDWWDSKDNKFKKRIAYGKQVINIAIRALLKEFFETYKGKLIYHNICYDAYILIYQLWMKELLDQEGLLTGLAIMLQRFECTQLITYLATNSCAGNKLSLKEQAHEFLGNYAEADIKDIRLIPEPSLLKYNGLDCLGTWFVFNKRHPEILADLQEDIYLNIFKPSVADMIQLQLTGMCLDMEKVLQAEVLITKECDKALKILNNSTHLKSCKELLRKQAWEADFLKRKLAAKNPSAIKPKDITTLPLTFNPNSGKQVAVLLYDIMGFPIIELTKTKQSATGGKVLKKLLNHAKNKEDRAIIQALRDYALGAKILSTFIPAFKNAPLASDGCHYVFGSFKLGGTVSGRLSAKDPNLQTIPSGSHFASLIKECFIAPPGYIMWGSDFNGLEDFINTVLTKDPNKIKILKEGFDGHSFRTAYYWQDKFSFIDTNDPKSVYRIKLEYGDWRTKSKPVSFALQYKGTWATLVKNCGFSEQEAKSIEANYLKLYKVSVAWVDERIDQASKVGYSLGAFGLRIRTPVLAQVILGNRVTPYEAQAEARTLGNAISGQSYSLLNNTSSVRFLKLVRAHPEYRLQIRPCAHIHDAQYGYAKDNFELLEWINKHLIEEMAWQDLPELQCEGLKIGSELDLFYPTWKTGFTIPNGSTADEIKQICLNEVTKRKEKENGNS